MKRDLISRSTILLFLAGTLLFSLSAQTPKPTKNDAIRALVFRLELNGLYPRTATVEEGWWSIRLLNGVITNALSLELGDENGVRLAGAQAPAGSGKSSFLVRLHPGKRVFRVIGNPGWRVEIIVNPKK